MGIWDVDAFMEECPAHVLVEWMAYDSIAPIGDEAILAGNAINTSTMVNLQLTSKAKPTSPADFLPSWATPKSSTSEQDTANDIVNKFKMLKANLDATKG